MGLQDPTQLSELSVSCSQICFVIHIELSSILHWWQPNTILYLFQLALFSSLTSTLLWEAGHLTYTRTISVFISLKPFHILLTQYYNSYLLHWGRLHVDVDVHHVILPPIHLHIVSIVGIQFRARVYSPRWNHLAIPSSSSSPRWAGSVVGLMTCRQAMRLHRLRMLKWTSMVDVPKTRDWRHRSRTLKWSACGHAERYAGIVRWRAFMSETRSRKEPTLGHGVSSL